MKEKILRKEIIQSKLSKISDNLDFIEKNLPDEFEEFGSSRMLKDSIYKEIEFSIQCVIDICAVINSDLRLGTPETEEKIFSNLENNNVFEKSLIKKISEMKSFRNILVHKYGDINDETAFENIKEGLADFGKIIDAIEKLISKGEKK
jgi:uncharacterized protein YutE (UPF0331/DUF86 family)